MMAALYKSKKLLKQSIGQPLRYQDTSMFGSEYKSNGVIVVVGPSPYERKWYAQVTMANDRIARVD